MAGDSLHFASFNMRGFKTGASMLVDLCNSHNIIAFQEHWLRSDDLKKLSLINKDFNFYAASGMDRASSEGLLRGRPFGGVGVLFHNSLQSSIKLIGCDNSNRCIAVKCSLQGKV